MHALFVDAKQNNRIKGNLTRYSLLRKNWLKDALSRQNKVIFIKKIWTTLIQGVPLIGRFLWHNIDVSMSHEFIISFANVIKLTYCTVYYYEYWLLKYFQSKKITIRKRRTMSQCWFKRTIIVLFTGVCSKISSILLYWQRCV